MTAIHNLWNWLALKLVWDKTSRLDGGDVGYTGLCVGVYFIGLVRIHNGKS